MWQRWPQKREQRAKPAEPARERDSPESRANPQLDALGNRARLGLLRSTRLRSNSPSSAAGNLDEDTRTLMESRFGESFRNVRIHTGTQAGNAAEALHSRAFTTSENIVFAAGEFAPQTSAGLGLLAHELAHVVQQRRSTGAIAGNTDTERDAHQAAREVMSGSAATVRERAAPGTVQRFGERELTAEPTITLGAPSFWTIAVDGIPDIVLLTGEADNSYPPRVKAWETADGICYVDVSGFGYVHSIGRWKDVRLGRPPMAAPAPPPPPKPKPSPPKQKPQPAKPKKEPAVQVLPEMFIGSREEDFGEPEVAPPEPDPRPLREQVVMALKEDPARAASLAPRLANEDLEQFTAQDRIDLLNALATAATGGLDVRTALRVIQTAGPSQQRELMEGLVAHDGRVLAALRDSVRFEDRSSLENGLFQLQLVADLRAGAFGLNPNLFDPLGARGFKPPAWITGGPSWARDLQFRMEPNGDWTVQAPGQTPLIIEGPLTQALRAERQNEKIASFEARHLSPAGKVARIKALEDNLWTGTGDEDRIINILRYTPANEAAQVLEGLKTTQSGGKSLLDQLDSAVQLENNVLLHVEIAGLRMRARKDDPKLLTDLAKAPMLPWRDALFHNRAVFTIQTLSDGRIAVTYGALQSFELEASEAFGAAMRALPKEMQHGGTLILNPDDIVIVNDTDANRQVPLTAADLVAFQHSANRGMLKHIGNVAAVVIPVGLVARGTIGLGQAALEVGGAVLAMGADEYRMELTKWSPELMRAIDIVNIAFAMKGGVDLARLGASGVRTIHSGLKKQYDAFKATHAAKMAASGDPNAIKAAQIADAQAQSLLRELEQIESGGAHAPEGTAVPKEGGSPLFVPAEPADFRAGINWNPFRGRSLADFLPYSKTPKVTIQATYKGKPDPVDFLGLEGDNGGRIWVSTDAVTHSHVDNLTNQLVGGPLSSGKPIEIISGTHGNPAGYMEKEFKFLIEDYGIAPAAKNVTIHNAPSMTDAELRAVLESGHEVILGFCDSQFSRRVMKALGLNFMNAPF